MLILVFILWLIAAPAWATTFYVATTGSNGNTCTQAQSISTPKQTIANGITCLSSGDTLSVGSGTFSETITLNSIPAGSDWNTTTKIIGAGAYSGTKILRDADNSGVITSATGAAYIEITDMEFDGSSNAGHDGVKFSHNFSHIRFSRLYIHSWKNQGVLTTDGLTASDLQLIHVESTDNGTNGSCFQANRCHGFYLDVDDLLIDGVNLHDNESNGMQFYPGPRSNPVMINSIVWDNPNWGIFVADGFSAGKFYNNTVYNNANGQDNVGFYYNRGTADCFVKNNIFYANATDSETGSCTATNNIETDPSFTDSGSGNFSLQSGSAARNTGTDLSGDGVTEDYAGTSRPQGAAFDIGAFEFIEAAPTYTLDVLLAGAGSGSVSSDPAGIDCGGDCTEDYDEDTEITLTAEAAEGSVFASWSGGGCSGTGTCIHAVIDDVEITATFNLAPSGGRGIASNRGLAVGRSIASNRGLATSRGAAQ